MKGGEVFCLLCAAAIMVALGFVVIFGDEPQSISTNCADAKIEVVRPEALGLKERDLEVLCADRLRVMGRG